MDGPLALAALLRTWRARLQPYDVGLSAAHGTRRTVGLRREEVAGLAGVSPEYVKRLEQGRAHPSDSVLRALARALRLSEAEFALASRLAGHADGLAGVVPRTVGPGVRRLVDRLSDTPVAVFDAAWTHLDHNDLWTALTGSDWSVRGEGRADGYGGDAANLVRRTFLGDTAPVRHPSPERHRAALVADLRDTAARYPADRELAAMVDELRRSSTEFARLWAEGRVARHETAVKTFDHARVGPLEVDCDVLSASGSDVRVVVYTAAPGSEAAGKLRLLSVLGAECAADGAGDRSGAV